MSFFLDTNVFIARMKEDDEFKEDATRLLTAIEAKKIPVYASVVTLMECTYVLKKFGYAKEKINDLLHALTEIEGIVFLPVTTLIIKEANDVMLQYNIGLSDAIIIATMFYKNVETIVTEDKEDFSKISFAKIISIKEAFIKL